ncbi:hypothetical protein [Cellulomonas dongxiuzhuiae]|uniref:Uncharacterized protein n=1 Tax=Cellulomonas dongxiuzhuiae TaxID=2819979 RepID=A0ABX8GLV5_9CELL|nr:hypothetical protein [Cellulomonas dongxiuzhuiae]MBO3095620.1 hypothetical protein [Cellulomonas dongxiuzhuiae]QWC16586.1 hypothetical protein KKR89_02655 [Cellulomonas dongxiuzhuiae]
MQGGSWVVKGGVKVVTGLRTAFKFDLDGFGGGFGPQVAVAGAGAGVRANPFAGLLNAMTEGSATSAGTAGRTPVRDAFFGPRETAVLDSPRADTPRAEAPRAEAPPAPRADAPPPPGVAAPDAPGAEAPAGPRADAPDGVQPEAPGSGPDAAPGPAAGSPQQPGRLWSPHDEPASTVPQAEAPNPDYTPDDVRDALDRAPRNADGQPVDHRTGEPLLATRADGTRGWHMVWDPENNLWVAERPGTGHPAPGSMPETGTPNSFGYDEHGQLMTYANSRPSYAPGQVEAVWEAAPKRTDEGCSAMSPDEHDPQSPLLEQARPRRDVRGRDAVRGPGRRPSRRRGR